MQTNLSRLAMAGFFLSAMAAFCQPLEIARNPKTASPSRHGTAALAFDLNAASIRPGVGNLRIQLPGIGGLVSLEPRRFEDRGGDGDGFWTGTADGRGDSEVLLTVKNGFMAGTIRYGSDVFEVRPTAEGHVIERLDFNSFPSCAGGQMPDESLTPEIPGDPDQAEPAGLRASGTSLMAAAGGGFSTVLAAGDPVYIDVMSVYTPQARAGAGGTAQIEAVIQAAVDAANQAFANSNIAVRYRLVRAAEVSYNETGNITTDLNWAVNDAGVAAQRNLYGADLVSLVVNNGGGYCGVGYVMRSVSANFAPVAFQVTVRACAVGNLTFAHEHGHNLGMEHDTANSVLPSQASYPWSFGHFVNSVFRTVMSYATVCPSGCRRIPYFSNPDVSYLGYPTGVANAFDNARTAGLTASIVAEFRSSGPAAPTGLNAVAVSAGQINLTWTDASANELGFKVERSASGGAFTQIATLGPNFVAFADLTVSQTTSYSYRLRSYNASGDSAYSNIASATTPLPPPPAAPSLLSATAASATQVNLAWADNSANETGFKVERSANGAGFVELIALPSGTTAFADSSAAGSTTYEYRVRASNAGGNSAYSNIAVVTTPAAASAPSAPTGLAATAGSATQVSLTWSDTSSNETGFKVERSTSGGAFVQIVALGANATAYADTTVSGGLSYAYRVRASNVTGDSGYSNTATVTTPSAPSAPSGLAATAGSATQVSLTWSDTSSNETGFKLERSADGGAFVQIVALGANTTAYADTTVSGGLSYAYRVRASNATGDSGYSNTATVTTPAAPTAPAAPTGLSATAASATQVNLAWSDASSNETVFKVERSTGGGAFVQIAALGANATGYADGTVSGGSSYAYRVRASNATGDSGYSNTATVTTPAAPTAPAAPGGLGASVISATQVNLTWVDASSNETGFKVERSVNSGAFVQIATAGANATGFADLTTIAGTAYAYRVRAYNSIGDSAYSNTATANTPAAPTAPSAPAGLSASAVSETQVNLAWADTSSNETGFKVERSTNGGGFVQIAVLGANAASFADLTTAAGASYAYRVRAYNGIGDSGYSNTATVSTPALQIPAAPTNLVATAVNALQINLTWADNANNESGYKIERSSGLRFTQIAVTGANSTSFADQTVSPGTLYFYRVRSTNAAGDSVYSSIYSVRTP